MTVVGERYVDAEDSGTLVWDPKVVENLTDAERKCIVTRLCCCHIVCRDRYVLRSLSLNEEYTVVYKKMENIKERINRLAIDCVDEF